MSLLGIVKRSPLLCYTCGVAVAVGLLASGAIWYAASSRRSAVPPATVDWTRPASTDPTAFVPVVFATTTIRRGQAIRAEHLTLRTVVQRCAPSEACAASIEQATGAIVRYTIYEGEPVLARRVDAEHAWRGIAYRLRDDDCGVALTFAEVPQPTSTRTVPYVDVAETSLRNCRLLWSDGARHAAIECSRNGVEMLLAAIERGPLRLVPSTRPPEESSVVPPQRPGSADRAERRNEHVGDNGLVKAVVCRHDILPGSRPLSTFDVEYRRVPERLLPRYCRLDIEGMVGMCPTAPMFAGELASTQRVCEPHDYRSSAGTGFRDATVADLSIANGAAVEPALGREERVTVYVVRDGAVERLPATTFFIAPSTAAGQGPPSSTSSDGRRMTLLGTGADGNRLTTLQKDATARIYLVVERP